jgi:putative ABC transport system permease protein
MARRTSTVYDRFIAYEDAPTMVVFGCTDGVPEESIAANYQEACGTYDYADLLDFLATDPGVLAAGRWTLAISNVAAADYPDDGWRQLVPVAIDGAVHDGLGVPIVVDGRLSDPNDATEATINEEEADRLGIGVGDDVIVTPYRRAEFDIAGEGQVPPGGPSTTVTVVGITRRPSDLLGRLGGRSIYEDTSAVMVGPAWWDAIDGDAAVYGIGVGVKTAPGYTNDDVIASIHERWPQRPWQIDTGSQLGQDNQQTVRDAIRLQAIGLYLVAAVVALAGLLFAGQALSRQSRLEWSDAGVLDAIGMTRRDMVRAGAIRSAAIAAVAAGAAFVMTTALSPLGPIGIGRAAEPHPGVDLDGLVLGVGLPLIALFVVASALVPIAIMRQRTAATSSVASTPRGLGLLPPPGVAGRAMASSRRTGRLALGSAVVGVAFATAAGIAALSLAASYDDLRADPARYGSAWDAQVGNVGDESQQTATRSRLEAIDGIESVGILSTTGVADDPNFTVYAGEPFLGDVELGTVVEGRAPTKPTEIALGRSSMHSFGVGIGDRITLTDPSDAANAFTFDVVGRVVVNDAQTSRPGVGGLVNADAMHVIAPETMSQTYVVWVEPGVDRAATMASLRQAFPTTFLEASTPRQVTNLGLVSNQPVLVALIIALLAGAALIHALVTSVRGSRRQIGVLKSIGFTNGQVVSSVAWHASLLAGGALVLGVPLGIVTGRVAWRTIVDDLGVASAPDVPLVVVVGVALSVLVVANLAALAPGWAAARTRAAIALRTE